MLVFVLNKKGKPLMPCSASKARRLLKEKKAYVINTMPFAIRLIGLSRGYKQNILLGVDAGTKYVGVSAVSKKQVLFESEIQLRNNIKKLLADRRELRRSRRARKTRYRKPRFLNRKRKEKWLAPSIKQKVAGHLKVIAFIYKLLPVSNLTIETAQFDIQKIKDPEISGKKYQEGAQLDFFNTREYVLFRDKHICQLCKGKSKDKVLNVHHIESRKTGSDAPDNLITLCKTCHSKVHKDKKEHCLLKAASFKDAGQITTMRWFIYQALKAKYPKVKLTYGYITKNKRIASKLEKSHRTDARCIANGSLLKPINFYSSKFVRRNNRSLHKSTILKGGYRKNNQAPREVFGFQLFDRVLFKNTPAFIYGRRSSGYFRLAQIDGTTIHNSASYKKIKLLEKAKTLLTTTGSGVSSPCLKAGVSTPSFF